MCVANFIPPANGASQGNNFLLKKWFKTLTPRLFWEIDLVVKNSVVFNKKRVPVIKVLKSTENEKKFTMKSPQEKSFSLGS